MSTENNNNQFKLYSNEAEMAVSFNDFSIQFKVSTPYGVENLGVIMMSPAQAKTFAKLLNQNVVQYESMFGIIPEANEELFKRLQEQGILKVGTP